MEQKTYTKKELRVLMESTGYPMASSEKTMHLLELLKAINTDEFPGSIVKSLYTPAHAEAYQIISPAQRALKKSVT